MVNVCFSLTIITCIGRRGVTVITPWGSTRGRRVRRAIFCSRGGEGHGDQEANDEKCLHVHIDRVGEAVYLTEENRIRQSLVNAT